MHDETFVRLEQFNELLDFLILQSEVDIKEAREIETLKATVTELRGRIAFLEARVLLVECQDLYKDLLENTYLKDAQDNQNSTSYGFLSTAEHMKEAFPTDHLPEGSH